MTVKKSSKLNICSPKIAEDRLELLKKEFPEIFTDGKIDVVKLKQTLGDLSDDSPERYLFSWAGRKDCIRLLQTPTQMTLTPDEKESIDYSNSENLIIEGDNLEVLKLLYKSYFGKVKMIYIDPPYNTGNDFVYSDDFRDTKNAYLKQTGQMDDNGNLQTTKADRNGHIHSSWLSMIYPRLFVARQLLRDDGVIFISIDDNEVHNLRIIMNEIFGEENFVGKIIWQTATDNNATQVAVEHEYILCFAKDRDHLSEWEINSTNGALIQTKYEELKKKHGGNTEIIQDELTEWIRIQKKNGTDLSGVSHYRYVDQKGVYYPGNSANTRKGGYTFDIIHPITTKICKKPENGYRWPEKTFLNADKNNDVEWGDDHNIIPKIKKRLESAAELLKSVYYEDNRKSTKELSDIFGEKVFDNPKSWRLIKKLMTFSSNPESIILDFFAGSGTTAQAVLEQNKEDNGNRKFILVQLPEITPENSEARKAGYKTIADICKERVRRVIKKIKEEQKQEKLSEKQNLDLGFKVFKLKESNFKAWEGVKTKDPKEYIAQMQLFKDPIKPKSKIEDILWEVAIKEGYPFTAEINKVKEVKNNTIYKIEDKQKNQFFYICLDDKISLSNLKPLNLKKENLFIARDIALNDEQQANLALQCNLKTL